MDEQLNPFRIDDAPELGLPEQEGYVLRLSDLYQHKNLRELGAKPGDRIVNNELVPVEPETKEPVDLGYQLTEGDINAHDNLKALGAKPGDRIVDGELVPTGVNDWSEQFRYAFDPEKNDVGYGAQWLEQRAPLGRFTYDLLEGFKGFFKGGIAGAVASTFSYESPDEAYGEGFSQATPEQRRDMMAIRKERELYDAYGPYFEPNQESAGAIAGDLASALTTPTTAIPLGAGLKTLVGGSALLGGSYTGLQSLAQTGELDVEGTLASAAIAGVAAPALVLAPKIAGKAVNYAMKPVRTKAANESLKEVQQAMNQAVSDGKTGDEIMKFVEESTGMTPEKIAKSVDLTGVEPVVAKSAREAEEALARSIAEDSATSRQFSTGLDKYLGTLSTRVRNISEPVFARLRNFEFDAHMNTSAKITATQNFSEGVSQLSPRTKTTLTTHLYNQEFDAAEAILKQNAPELVQEFNVVKKVLEQTKTDLKKAGHTFEGLDDYFPRVVKDLEGLQASFGKVQKNIVDNALDTFAKANGKTVNQLNADDKAHVIDMVFRDYRVVAKADGSGATFVKRTGTGPEGRKPGAIQQRKIDKVRPDQLQYYASPEESLQIYLRRSVNDIARRKMFGQAGVPRSDGTFDLDESIGSFVQKELDAGNITSTQAVELKELLSSRFIGGEQTPGSSVSWLRDTGYMGTIANPISAITQLGDLGISGALNGFRHTIAGMLGTKSVKTVDLGIDSASAEFINPSRSSRLLNKLFKATGFQAIDRLGKNTFMAASIRKAQSMVQSPAGVAKFKKQYGNIFGDEIDSVIADLQAKRVSENVKFFAFNELADVQPIALSEMPQWYLDNPNGRILYMLKSFTLKQYDIARRKIVQEAAKGNYVEASKNAALLLGYMTAANTGTQMVKDFALGREVDVDQIPDRALWALLGVYGVSKYTGERYIQTGQIKEGIINLVTPATPIVDAGFGLASEASKLASEYDDPNFEKYTRNIPGVGPILYNWFFGGAEKWNERQQD